MIENETLLADYVDRGSEAAFRTLVERYLGLVYGTALRLVDGDTHLAEDVAQTVFTDLARKARGLSGNVKLGGWLYQRAHHVAAPMMRAQRRRWTREREAAQMNAMQNDPETDLALVAPLLDEAMTQLDTDERTAILLRFFERCDFRAVGRALGASEDAARMRVNRALDKLQGLLKQRGVSLSAGALAAALASETITAAPAGMAASIAAIAVANGTAGGGLCLSFIHFLSMTKVQASIIGALVVTGLGTAFLWQHQAKARLSAENEALRRQVAQLQAEGEQAPKVAAPSVTRPSGDQLRELLRLRNEVSQLRRQQREREQAASGSRSSNLAAQPVTTPAGVQLAPAPFQLQLVLDEPGEDVETMTNRSQALFVQKKPLLDYTALRTAAVGTNPQTGGPQIEIEFNEEGKELFAQITREHLNRRLAIVLDGRLCTAPVIRSEITGGRGVVEGSFTAEEARELAAKINEAIQGK